MQPAFVKDGSSLLAVPRSAHGRADSGLAGWRLGGMISATAPRAGSLRLGGMGGLTPGEQAAAGAQQARQASITPKDQIEKLRTAAPHKMSQ